MGYIVNLFGEDVEIPSGRERLAELERKRAEKKSSFWDEYMAKSPEERQKEYERYMAEHEAHYKGSEERLAYYRSHGLAVCDDYPGGDAAFERDVLSGEQREERDFTFELKREDAYIYKCLEDGQLVPEIDFLTTFHMHPKVRDVVELVCGRLYWLSVSRPPQYYEAVWSPDSYLYKKG